MSYDSWQDTQDHIDTVRKYMVQVIEGLRGRYMDHDKSKLEPPEKPLFDEWTPKLSAMTYGSDEYKAALKAMGPALRHHYEVNSHHPEHYGEEGVSGMDLLDLVEMVCDWKAASERHADGDFYESVLKNVGRFELSDQLTAIILNTGANLGWFPPRRDTP